MKRMFSLGSLFAVLALVVVFATVPGCPEKKPTPTPPVKGDGGGDLGSGGGDKKKTEPLAVKAFDGVVKGKVTLDGKAPEMAAIDMGKHEDRAMCHAPKKQDWIVGEGNGVANVIVILEPPAGKFFAVDEKLVKEYKDPTIDQPHCVYEPHIIGIFAAYKGQDGKAEPTGLKLLVKNTGEISHNTKVQGEVKYNPLSDINLSPKTVDGKPAPITFQKSPINISCSKHGWMEAKVITFDHPFFAVTDKDGNFEIKNVPTGVELGVKVWHEVAAPNGLADKSKTFSKGDNELPLKIKAPS